MFFIISINEEEKSLEYKSELLIHDDCGSYGRYTVFIRYMILRIFFIPILKWNKKYFVKTSCCDRIYSLDKEVGRKIEIGEDIKIKNSNLTSLFSKNTWQCKNCGYTSKENFNFCPICGKDIKWRK